MKRFSQLLLSVTILFLLLWQLPWCYNFFASSSDRTPFTIYSTLVGDFVQTLHNQNGKGAVRRDLSGKVYTESEFDSILPMFYVRQLVVDERFPDTICGVSVNPRLVQMANFTFRSTPSEINSVKIGLYPLMESLSGRVDLKMPNDVFRITSEGLEFIDIQSNLINQSKSLLFTEALKRKGFLFPAIEIAGNPTVRKDYDEGYLLLDSRKQLFHLKRMRGRPFVRQIELPQDLVLKHLFITEFKNRRTLAFMTDVKNQFYVLKAKSYEVEPTGISSFNPETDDLMIFGDLFNWTVKIAHLNMETFYALKASDYSLVKCYKREVYSHYMPGIHFSSFLDNDIFPRIN